MSRGAMAEESFVLPGGYLATLDIERDDCMGEPWKEHDGHGPVSDWVGRPKGAGELALAQDRNQFRFYDAKEAQKIALRDGWDSPPYKTGPKKERAARAVKADFEWLRGWCVDDWCWVVLSVKVSRDGKEIASDSLCGIESCGDYWKEEGRRMAECIVHDDMFRRHTNWCRALAEMRAEASEVAFWATRGVATDRRVILFC